MLPIISGCFSRHASKSFTSNILWSRSTPSATNASGKARTSKASISNEILTVSFRNIAMIIKIHWKFIQIQITFLNYGEKISKKKWKKRVRKEKIKNEEPKKKKRKCSRMNTVPTGPSIEPWSLSGYQGFKRLLIFEAALVTFRARAVLVSTVEWTLDNKLILNKT